MTSMSLTMEDSIAPSDLENLSNRLKSTIWFLTARSERCEYTWTGFSVKSDGIVMSCAHASSDLSKLEISARMIDSDVVYVAGIISQRSNWDLLLLQIENLDECETANFVEDGLLFEGQKLLHLGNPLDLVGSLLLGYCVFPCVDNVTLPNDGDFEVCREYKSDSLKTTPGYRILGHVMNSLTYKRLKKEPGTKKDDLVESMKYHPLIPIIQCSGFFMMQGSSGGPVFNLKGEVVGMLIREVNGYDVAIHVSLLKHFLRIALEEKEHRSLEKSPSIGQGVSKESKNRT